MKNGAMRTTRKPLYHLVPIQVLTAISEAQYEGDNKYAPGNWQQGDTLFFIDCLNHAIEHLMLAGTMRNAKMMQYHLGRGATNIGYLLWGLDLNRLTPDDIARAAVLFRKKEKKSFTRRRKNGLATENAGAGPDEILAGETDAAPV